MIVFANYCDVFEFSNELTVHCMSLRKNQQQLILFDLIYLIFHRKLSLLHFPTKDSDKCLYCFANCAYLDNLIGI